MNTCPARVWDNGDMTDCGAPIVAHGLCDHHLSAKRAELVGKIGRLAEQLSEAHAELTSLFADVLMVPAFHERFERARAGGLAIDLREAAQIAVALAGCPLLPADRLHVEVRDRVNAVLGRRKLT